MKTIPARREETGNTILVTILTMAIVGVFIDLSLQYTNNVAHNVQRSLLLRQAVNIGDSSTEMSFAAWRRICRAKQTSVLPGSSFDNELPTPSPGNFPGVTYSLSNYKVDPLDSKWVVQTKSKATPAPIAGPNHGDVSYYYLATADVVIPTATSKTAGNLAAAAALTDHGNIVAKVRRVFQKETLSLWRYAVFYKDDCEIHPGATMAVNGPVHTNGSLYTGHNLLSLNGKTTYTDKWSIGFMPGEGAHGGETPTSPKFSLDLTPAQDQAQLPYGVQLDDYHGLIEPITDKSDPLYNYALSSQAGVTVTIDASNNVRIFNASGKDITGKTGNNGDGKTATAFSSAISTNESLTDKREAATTGIGTVRITTLDVGVIQEAMDHGGVTFNGVIYINDTSAGFASKTAANFPMAD